MDLLFSAKFKVKYWAHSLAIILICQNILFNEDKVVVDIKFFSAHFLLSTA